MTHGWGRFHAVMLPASVGFAILAAVRGSVAGVLLCAGAGVCFVVAEVGRRREAAGRL